MSTACTLQCRLPATTHCLSHPSAHVRALSTSVLRDILGIGPIKSSSKQEEVKAVQRVPPLDRYLNIGGGGGDIDWNEEIEKCLRWEAQRRHETGMNNMFLEAASKELGVINIIPLIKTYVVRPELVL